MKYQIAVCDDNPTDSEYIVSLVKLWAETANITVFTDCFSCAENFLFSYEDNKRYDILLLDIEMEQMNGVELAKKIRQTNREIQIVFITGYNEYIADGYDVEALHYILKPVHKEKLFTVLDRAREKLKKNEAAVFLNLPDGMVRIPLYEIRFIEVHSNYITIHASEEITVKMTLSALEKKLDESFFRTGRSYIVNMHYIRKITKTEAVLEGGSSIPLPRGCYEPLNRAFIQYF